MADFTPLCLGKPYWTSAITFTDSPTNAGSGTESGEQSSTAVLATLAALAEATGPLSASNSTSQYWAVFLDCTAVSMYHSHKNPVPF